MEGIILNDVNRLKEKVAKVITFVIPGSITGGIQDLIIRFPFKGKIIDINATAFVAGTSDTIISVESCPETILETDPIWTPISNDIIINSGSLISSNIYTVNNENVVLNDYFRVNITTPSNIQGLNLEVKIKI